MNHFTSANEESLVNLGSFNDVIYQHKSAAKLSISVSWKLLEKMDIRQKVIDFLSFSTTFINKDERLTLDNVCYRMEGQNIKIAQSPEGYILEATNEVWSRLKFFRCYGIRGSFEETTEVIFSSLEKTFENLFSQILYLGPLREYPRRHYPWGGRSSKRDWTVWRKDNLLPCSPGAFDAFPLTSRYQNGYNG